jgi:hypothetical protein
MKKRAALRILIGIPKHHPTQEFLLSLSSFLSELQKQEQHYKVEVLEIENKTLVEAQNIIASHFLTNAFDFLLLVENDHSGYSVEMLKALLRANAEIVGMNYYSRHMPYYTCLMEQLPHTHINHRFGHIDQKSGYRRVDLTGWGMTLIKKSLFKKLDEPYFRLNKDGGEGCYATDVDFCDRLKKANVDIIGCFDYILNHRDITATNRLDKMIEGFEDIKKSRQIELKQKGFGV